MRRVTLILLVAAAALRPAASAAQSLEECLALARRNAPALRVSDAGVARAEQAIREARAAFGPSLDVTASFVQNSESPKIVIPTSPTTQEVIAIGKSQSLDARGELKLTVYSRESSALIRAAEAAHAGQTSDRERAEADLALRVSTAFYRALAAERLEAAAQAAVDSASAHLGVSAARVRAGVAQRVDSLRAQVDLSQRNTALLRTQQAVHLTRVDLENAIGAPLDTTRSLESPGEPPADVPELPAALEQASRGRAELAVLDQSIRETDERLAAVHAHRWPELSLNATAEYLAPNVDGDYENFEDPGLKTYKLFAGAKATLPLLDGGRTDARAREIEADRAALEARRADAMLAVRRDVEGALSDLRVALAVWRSDSGRVATAEEALRLAEAGYKGGTQAASDVRDAEAVLADARAEEAQSLMDYWIARASLDHATGAAVTKGS